MDIYVHLGINKGGIQRKHIFLLWVGREEHNVQTPSFSMKWCVVWLNHLTYCGTQSKKTVIIKMIFYERFQQMIEGIIQQKLYSSKCILFIILQTYTSVTQERISATRTLSVTTLKALTIVHANQDILEMALIAQVIL